MPRDALLGEDQLVGSSDSQAIGIGTVPDQNFASAGHQGVAVDRRSPDRRCSAWRHLIAAAAPAGPWIALFDCD
jgi:hypothetical protein